MSIKLNALATVAALGTATLASASTNYFSYGETLPSSSTIDLGTLSAADSGMVEIYEYRGGEVGQLLGSTDINAGANQDVRIQLKQRPLSDVIAIMTVNGQVVAEKDYRISERM